MPSKRLRAPRPTLLPQPLLQEALGSGSGHNLISEHAPSQPNEAPEQDLSGAHRCQMAPLAFFPPCWISLRIIGDVATVR